MFVSLVCPECTLNLKENEVESVWKRESGRTQMEQLVFPRASVYESERERGGETQEINCDDSDVYE